MKSKQKQTPTEIVDNQRQAVVEKIIEDMKRDGLRWAEPYLPSLTPHNPVSGTVYQGGNRVHLGFIGFMRGYTDNRWATFNQIKDAGWHVKKGAKSALIEKWKQFAFYKENEDTGEKELAGALSEARRLLERLQCGRYRGHSARKPPPSTRMTGQLSSPKTLKNLPDAQSSRAPAISAAPPTLRLQTASSSPRERPSARTKRSPASCCMR